MLRTILKKELDARHLSVRAAAKEIGVSHTTIQRLYEGKKVDVETIKAICDWLGISFKEILRSEVEGDSDIAASLEILSEKAPELAELFDHLIAEVTTGNLTMDDVREIIDYADFKITQRNRKAAGGRSDTRPTQEAPA